MPNLEQWLLLPTPNPCRSSNRSSNKCNSRSTRNYNRNNCNTHDLNNNHNNLPILSNTPINHRSKTRRCSSLNKPKVFPDT